jgi:AcrR family transcriptional regulator
MRIAVTGQDVSGSSVARRSICEAVPVTVTERASTKPLRRDAERNRERILQAAREVFAERGIDVTLHDIARHAGLGVGTIYRRFANREELIDALFVDNFDRLGELAREALVAEDPWEGFSTFFTESVAAMANDRGLWIVMTTAASKGRNFLVARERVGALVQQLLRRAQDAGVLRADLCPDDLPVLNVILGSGADFMADAAPQVWRRYVGIVLDGLRERRDAPTPLDIEVPSPLELDKAMEIWRPGKR